MKPQVKESEKNRILSTTDYNLFILPEYRLSKKFLSEIEESIQEKNLSKDYPILVEDKTYRIIDGRYRFVACKGKKLPIYYKIAEVTSIYDAVRIKNLVKRSDYELVLKTFSDIIESYNNILILSNELFPEVPIKYIIRATGVCNRAVDKIDHKRFQCGKMPEFNFEEVKDRLQTLVSFYDYFKAKIDFLTWSDTLCICEFYNWDREVIESMKSFIFSCRNIAVYYRSNYPNWRSHHTLWSAVQQAVDTRHTELVNRLKVTAKTNRTLEQIFQQ